MDEQRDQEQGHSGDQAGAARHALEDQRREDERARETNDAPDAGGRRTAGSDQGSALGPEGDDAVSEASAESFPASDPPATSRHTSS